MKVHAYKCHEVESLGSQRVMWITGICGGSTPLHHVAGEDTLAAIADGQIRMFTVDPSKVTCGSCRRSRKFSLLELDSITL